VNILVVGIYLSDIPNTQEHLSGVFGASREHEVEQRWMEMTEATKEPKYPALNRLLADVERFDYVIVTDDDTNLAPDWLDSYIAVQNQLGFALAQPAHLPGSIHSYTINDRHSDLLGRETRFVEIGPLFSVARVAYPHIFPFDDRAEQGWGLDLIWPYRLAVEHLRLGVIDAYPILHQMRPQGLTYRYDLANADRDELLRDEPHLAVADAQVEVMAYPLMLAVPD
jgi:hypothetical protein